MADARRSFATGSEAAKTERTSFSNRLPQFSVKDGEIIYEQFLMNPEEWITVGVHTAIPTKAKPADYTGTWPKAMSAVCPNWKMADGLPVREGGCFICDHVVPLDEKRYKAKKRTFGLGMRRVEIIGDGTEALGGPAKQGKRVGWGVETMEVPKRDAEGKIVEGEKDTVPRIEVFAMGWQNFWQKVDGACAAFGGSITNQIFAIRRTGTGLDTDYSPTPIKEIKQDFNDPAFAAKYGIKIDGNGNKEYPPHLDLYDYVMGQSAPDYIERFWVPSTGPTVVGAPATAAPIESNANLEAMRQRLAAAASGNAPAVAPAAAPAAVGPDADLDLEEA